MLILRGLLVLVSSYQYSGEWYKSDGLLISNSRVYATQLCTAGINQHMG